MNGIEKCKVEVEYNFLNDYEAKRFLSKLDKEFRRKGDFDLLREICIVKFMLETGIRASECLQLLPSDVFLNQSYIHIRAEIAKNRKARIVPISNPVLHCLSHIIREQRKIELVKPECTGLWFKKDGTRYTYGSLSKRIKTFAKWAEIPKEKVYCHNFRHYCATSRLKAGEIGNGRPANYGSYRSENVEALCPL
ncbi:site-specific integrase [Paenibacillus validus]|nr:site-specific integrase [Paenibacillus validus]